MPLEPGSAKGRVAEEGLWTRFPWTSPFFFTRDSPARLPVVDPPLIFGVDGNPRLGEGAQPLVHRSSGPVRTLEKRLMTDDPSPSKTRPPAPALPCPVSLTSQACARLRMNSAIRAHLAPTGRAPCWGRPRLPGQHFRPSTPFPSFPSRTHQDSLPGTQSQAARCSFC